MQLTEEQIETIIAETCGTYRTGGSYTFEDVWNCIEKALAAHNAGAQEPIATLHDDGYFTWKPGMRPQNVCQAGWRMDVFAAQPQLMTDAARDAKTCADATQIATVVKDLIELLVLWNSQASAGLDIAGLVGLRDELTEIERGEREGSKS